MGRRNFVSRRGLGQSPTCCPIFSCSPEIFLVSPKFSLLPRFFSCRTEIFSCCPDIFLAVRRFFLEPGSSEIFLAHTCIVRVLAKRNEGGRGRGAEGEKWGRASTDFQGLCPNPRRKTSGDKMLSWLFRSDF